MDSGVSVSNATGVAYGFVLYQNQSRLAAPAGSCTSCMIYDPTATG